MKHFIYKTTNLINGHYYVGKHSSLDIENDNYLGSGKHLINAIKKYGKSNFKRQILYEYQNQNQAWERESDIVTKDFISKMDTYNSTLGGRGFSSGYKIVKDDNGDVIKVKCSDQNQFKGVCSGLVTVKDQNGKCSKVKVTDYRYLSGELKHNCVGLKFDKSSYCHVIVNGKVRYVKRKQALKYGYKVLSSITQGKIVIKDEIGNPKLISSDDEGWKLGKYVGYTKGKVPVKDQNNNIFQVDKDDPRYISKKLVSNMTGLVNVKGEDGKVIKVKTTDPKYVSGQLKFALEGTVIVKDKDGNKFRVSTQDPRYKSGELIMFKKGCKGKLGELVVRDKDNKRYKVNKTDSRIGITLFPINSGKVKVYKDGSAKLIFKEQIEMYINMGWELSQYAKRKLRSCK